MHSDLLDFANGLEVTLLRASNSDLASSEDWMSDDGESYQLSDNPISTDDKVEAEELDDDDGWTGFGSESSQHDQATEDVVAQEPETRQLGMYCISRQYNRK